MRAAAISRTPRLAFAGLGVAVLAAATSACATTAPSADGASGSTGKTINVVAAENFWGSIAQQLGGRHVNVTSIITNPATDPHDYEPTPADGRAVAESQLAIVNGVGYDAWADKLLASNAGADRTELNVGDLVGIKPGGNPHRWYDPDNVRQVIDKITDDYKKIDPADAAYFDRQKNTYVTKTLAPYTQLIDGIRAKYAGTPVGASESIVTPLAEGLGLTMKTPESFLDAISEGSDPTAHDKATIDQQIKSKQIKIYVYNSQNSTPDVQAQVNEAKAQGIPVVSVTETLAPAGTSFQDWQVKQLQEIEQALAKATGK
ncbi:zinc ABC transporter substrate-binding protein [Streptomyces sp. RB6PN25]|uniref:Zinc ABC transporter substrate-binding protein n=1 Tax=Streptomyces humicola TaxID=2953240 RepID=A0ABT1Q7G7_9ACTN|nr:zinc ABC transporter substrate-binding protein [Streptomyces humicola]MCQ4084712.1 zinc ABC transporter substrate-binding protein [Streptomyces humicola]